MNIKQFWQSRTRNQKGGLLSAALLGSLMFFSLYTDYSNVKQSVIANEQACSLIAKQSLFKSTEVLEVQVWNEVWDENDERAKNMMFWEKFARKQGLLAAVRACSVR